MAEFLFSPRFAVGLALIVAGLIVFVLGFACGYKAGDLDRTKAVMRAWNARNYLRKG